jgi:hypothetical protein
VRGYPKFFFILFQLADVLVGGVLPVTGDVPKKKLIFAKGICWSVCLNVRFATEADPS